MPTNKEKNNLPFDIRKSYNISVDTYQQINFYEMGIISESEFIKEVRRINDKYKNINETDPLLA